jgi:DNA-binding transcriptional regulator YiaG
MSISLQFFHNQGIYSISFPIPLYIFRKKYPVKQKTFSDKLKALRIEANLSREKLAEHLKVSKSAVTNWEQGEAFPCGENLKKLKMLFKRDFDSPQEGDICN